MNYDSLWTRREIYWTKSYSDGFNGLVRWKEFQLSTSDTNSHNSEHKRLLMHRKTMIFLGKQYAQRHDKTMTTQDKLFICSLSREGMIISHILLYLNTFTCVLGHFNSISMHWSEWTFDYKRESEGVLTIPRSRALVSSIQDDVMYPWHQ